MFSISALDIHNVILYCFNDTSCYEKTQCEIHSFIYYFSRQTPWFSFTDFSLFNIIK